MKSQLKGYQVAENFQVFRTYICAWGHHSGLRSIKTGVQGILSRPLANRSATSVLILKAADTPSQNLIKLYVSSIEGAVESSPWRLAIGDFQNGPTNSVL
jgi:hypothetical protein